MDFMENLKLGSRSDIVDNISKHDQQTHPETNPGYHIKVDFIENQILECNNPGVTENADKHSANWTSESITILLKLYADKVEMLETPKKKTAMWIAISQCLKDYDFDMTPNQVRWKINALTQKYKQCLDSGQHDSFKYFKEMDNIYGNYYMNGDELGESHENGEHIKKQEYSQTKSRLKLFPETRSMIELRKLRLANRIESERSQSKMHIEKQWLEYLRKEEEHNLFKFKLYERRLQLREEELALRRKQLNLKESFELKKMAIQAQEQEEFNQIESEKCNLLRILIDRKRSM